MDDFEMEDFDMNEYVHDEDSDYPMEICDEEPELDDDQVYMQNLIMDTIDELEEAIGEPEQEIKPVTVPRATALRALQLLKTYNALYCIDRDDYDTEWD